jgi:NAD(P)-dependent dehydrogenase (short-subunit alcohol dehydrogenase family)
MSVNLRGIFLCTKHALPNLKKFRGTIINIASIGGVYVIGGGITAGRPRLA